MVIQPVVHKKFRTTLKNIVGSPCTVCTFAEVGKELAEADYRSHFNNRRLSHTIYYTVRHRVHLVRDRFSARFSKPLNISKCTWRVAITKGLVHKAVGDFKNNSDLTDLPACLAACS